MVDHSEKPVVAARMLHAAAARPGGLGAHARPDAANRSNPCRASTLPVNDQCDSRVLQGLPRHFISIPTIEGRLAFVLLALGVAVALRIRTRVRAWNIGGTLSHNHLPQIGKLLCYFNNLRTQLVQTIPSFRARHRLPIVEKTAISPSGGPSADDRYTTLLHNPDHDLGCGTGLGHASWPPIQPPW